MAILCALTALAFVVLSLASILLYLDGRGARAALAAWQAATDARLDNHGARIAALEGGPGTPSPVGVPPAPSGGDAPPKSTGRRVSMHDQSARAVERWEARADEIRDEATLVSVRDAPTWAEIRAEYEREADAKDARDANRTALLPGGEPDDDRITDEGETRFFNRKRPAPHKPPVPIKSTRPTMLGGMAGAPDPKRLALALKPGAKSGPALGAGFEPPRDPPVPTPGETASSRNLCSEGGGWT